LSLVHEKLDARVFDFERLDVRGDEPSDDVVRSLCGEPIDDVFLCLGTTLAQAGSKEAFRQVDFHRTAALARVAKRGGASRAAVVSSVGASTGSLSFYLRVKGEMEEALRAVGFTQLAVLRPGLLRGDRRDHRAGEALAQRLAPLTDALSLGPLRRYRSVDAGDVSRAMVAALATDEPGVRVLVHDAILALARAPSLPAV
jgi:uncharacterized protein YbjT (DUF2867 family)